MSVTAASDDRGENERPPIRGVGLVVEVKKPGHLYLVEMKNGHRAYAVAPKGSQEISVGESVSVEYSPYDMSRCKLVLGS